MKDSTSKHKEHVSVRFAPSPTGHLHIGGVRTALFNWLFARQQGGSFYLRIEDTDQERSHSQYEKEIIESFAWLGLSWDGNAVKQSDRLHMYRTYADTLIEKGLAYSIDEETSAVKFSMPKEKISFRDRVYGAIEFDASTFDDLVIIKSDGYPTWLFACVVDDYEMGITDIIRGEDHISNTPRQILLARSLGFRIPQYTHLPLIFGSDGTPLSKRHGATSLQAYRARGYCAEGILNYLALLGWGPPGDKEFFKLNDLIHAFSLKRVNKTNAVFDEQKLNHINALHFKNMGMDDYCSQGTSYFTHQHTSPTTYDRENIGGLLKIYKDRIASFSDLVDKADYFFQDTVSFDEEAVNKYFTNDQIPHYLTVLIKKLQQCESFNDVLQLEETVRSLAQELGIKAAQLIHPIRVALTGKGTSPGIFDVMSVLGEKRSLQRLQHCVDNFEAIVKQSS